MEFLLLAMALALAAGVAGLRLTIGAHRRIGAVGRLHDSQMAGARRRITDLEVDLCDSEGRLRRAQAVEAATRRTQTGLLTAVSREMRVPLDTVLGFADLLRLNEASEPLGHRQLQAVEQIRDGGARLLAIIDGLRVLAAADRAAVMARDRLDPLLIAHRVCQRLADQAQAAQVELPPPPPQAGLTALGDAMAVEQILTGLIANAVQYNRPGGAVRIEGRCVDDQVWVTVSDTGPGISARRLQTLFDPFVRRDRSAPGRAASPAPDPARGDDGARAGAVGAGVVGAGAVGAGTGTGVGLAVARRLVAAMNGRLEVESIEGQGAAFTLRLPSPLSATPSSGPDKNRADARPLLAGLPASVLLYVADDPSAVALMRHLMHGLDRIQLYVAATAREAAALARDLRPDAVILDVDLPDGDGFAVKAALEADPLTRDLPVVALSAAVDPVEVRRGQAAGFVDYLTKPVRIAALAEVLSHILGAPDAGSDKGPDLDPGPGVTQGGGLMASRTG